MDRLDVRQIGDPVLTVGSEPVIGGVTPKIKELAGAMIETMYASHGVGLAAPQVGRNLRMFVYDPIMGEGDPRVVINPIIRPYSTEEWVTVEGCLSIPGKIVEVPRFKRITLIGRRLDGAPILQNAEDMEARIIQHEVDHLNGVLITRYERS